ncbi:MAG: HEAT repeat domain-containing protein [Candidatus Cloacimonadaceae bacterium]|nr:HEAT repeat domain-containing protein [Candidatus Cloacimonadaceae bacterium]MDP3114735.1 HEAT repeat domain-containing protein [Candidatus Cloacimonadaceae bacterium]
MPKYLILILLALSTVLLSAIGKTPQEQAALAQLPKMLDGGGLDSLSIAFEKDWDLSTKFKNQNQLDILSNPWNAFPYIADMRLRCHEASTICGAAALMDYFGSEAWQSDVCGLYDVYKSFWRGRYKEKVRKPADVLDFYEGVLKELKPRLDEVFGKLNKTQTDSLTAFFFTALSENEDAQKYKDFLKGAQLPNLESYDLQRFAWLFEQADYQALHNIGICYLAASDLIFEEAPKLRFTKTKPIIKSSPYGVMIIGGTGDDVYNDLQINALLHQPLCFVLDPKGNDRYEAPLNTIFDHPFYLAIDLFGDDTYRNPYPGGLFSVRAGYGFSYDKAGNDSYQSDDFSFCAFLGMGMHRDESGNDIYQAGLFTQGAALFGVYALIDVDGNDSYTATSLAQGMGSTCGVGTLVDLGGADVYYIGGKYFHAPLMPLDYRSMGQGMGFGFRPDYAGGLGLLFDAGGNDKYIGGVYAQGVGYWYAMGLLVDESGNDVYNAIYYPQGSGIHLACGMLYDREGDDVYYSRNGPGQGSGHDWGFGLLVDGAGNDAYSIHGGVGVGLTNSVGIFIDVSGDDRYERAEANNYGYANFARSTGGIGLFLDAGGKDSYPDSLRKNDHDWTNGTYGIGNDVSINEITKTAIEALAEQAAAPDSLDTIANIFAAASEWEVGSAVLRVKAARAILLSREEEAINYIINNKINSKSGLEYRAMEALVRVSGELVRRLYPLIFLPDSLAAKNALSLIAASGDSLVIEPLKQLLAQKKYITACLSLLSYVNSAESVDILSAYVSHPSERYRYITARSLMQIKHPSARVLLLSMEQDTSFLVKTLIKNLPIEEK